MANPPTFVTDYEGASWSTTTSPKTTGAFNGSLGDVLASFVGDPQDNGTDNYTWSSSPVETWTERAESTGTTSADAWVQAATTILTAARTGMTVSVARTAGTAEVYNHTVAHFTSSDGVGNTAASGRLTGAPSWSFTTNFDNSSIVAIFVDFNAGDGTTRTWRTVNGNTPTAGNGQELTYFRNTTDYAVYIAYWLDAGAAGAKTLGLSAPAAGTWVAAGVEIRGTAAAPSPGPYAQLRPAIVAP